MENEDIKALVRRYQTGDCSEEEKALLESWYLSKGPEGIKDLSPEEFAVDLLLIGKDLPLVSPAEPIRISIWPRAAAAAVAIMIFGAGLSYFTNTQKNTDQLSQTLQNVAPGKQGATLTLASGKKIRLSDVKNGELAKEAGVVISKSADGQLVYEVEASGEDDNKTNTLSTANGETYRLRLPDGSLVWLNSASSLTYSANLVKDGRRGVRLTGEGYFQVAKDQKHPFVVQTGKQEVEVLGTHFNLNSYADEPAKVTTLLEGSVKVSDGANQQLIRPGFQAVNNGKSIELVRADTESITDWKEGDFNLADVDFNAAMRKIARWYDVKVVYDQDVKGTIELGGWISREKSLSSVLKFIEKTGMVHFRVNGKTVYVSRKLSSE